MLLMYRVMALDVGFGRAISARESLCDQAIGTSSRFHDFAGAAWLHPSQSRARRVSTFEFHSGEARRGDILPRIPLDRPSALDQAGKAPVATHHLHRARRQLDES